MAAASKELCERLVSNLGVWVALGLVMDSIDFLSLQGLNKWFYSTGIARAQQRLA